MGCVIPSNDGFITNANSGVGLLYEVSPNTTYYIEYNLQPNTLYNRYLAVYNSTGTNISSRFPDGRLLPVGVTTFAHAPVVAAEVFKFVGDTSYEYEPIPTQTELYKSTFSFTSGISTGPVEYYRVAFTTRPTHTFTTADLVWIPTVSTVVHPVGGNTITKKPEVLLKALFNATSFYFHAQTYSKGHQPSGVTVLGPFNFQGAPSRITDLVATPSTTHEGRVVLTWTAPSANEATSSNPENLVNGRFIIKRRENFIIHDDTQFDAAITVANISTSVVRGQRLTYVVTGLAPGSVWGFAIKSVDSEDNYSQLSTNILFSTNTRTTAAKVSKIVFTNPQRTTYVGIPTLPLRVEFQDDSGNPLMLFEDNRISFDNYNFSETLEPWSGVNHIIVSKEKHFAEFYYKSLVSGEQSIVAKNDEKGWLKGEDVVIVLPGKAVKFECDTPAVVNIGQVAEVTVRANDGYNPSNISEDYEGLVVATATIPGSVITPRTTYYFVQDKGKKKFEWRNTLFAGSGVFSVVEEIPQGFSDVTFFNNSEGYICADEGMIKKTGDGGVTWFAVRYSTGALNGLNSVSINTTGNNVVACGVAGRVLVSTDALRPYNIVDTGAGVSLNAVYFVNASTVYAAGNSGRVIKSTDSGFNWSSNIGPPTTENLNSIYFINDSTGFVCGNSGMFYKTTDSGLSWTQKNFTTVNLNEIKFVDENVGYVVGNSGKIFKTTDSGENWTDVSNSQITENLRGVAFNNANDGFVVGDKRTILKTTNGGESWTSAISTAALSLFSISFAGSDRNTLIAVGERGTIYRSEDFGTSWSELKMRGQSSVVNWNGVIAIATSPVTKLIQGVENQVAIKIMVNALYGGSSTLTKFQIRLSGGTGGDSDVSGVKLWRDRNSDGRLQTFTGTGGDGPALGGTTFSGGVAIISGLSNSFTNSATYFVTLDISPDAVLDNTLGFVLEHDDFGNRLFETSAGLNLARNGLPFYIPPIVIVPRDCTLRINVGDMSRQYTEVKQGQRDVFISSFSMLTNRSNTPWQRLIVRREGINSDDASIERIELWQSSSGEWADRQLVSSAAFGKITAGLAYLNITDQVIDDKTTKYYYLTVDISPTAVPYTDTTDARFWLLYDMTTAYFRLDDAGVNSIVSNVPGGSYKSKEIRISPAFDKVKLEANDPPIAISIFQSEIQSFIPFRLYLEEEGGRADWTKLRVLQSGDASDTDIESVRVYRDRNGDNVLQVNSDVLLGSAKFVNKHAEIILFEPEPITKTLAEYPTYFLAVSVSKRATEGRKIQVSISSESFTLAGNDIVEGPTLMSPSAMIGNYNDKVSVSITQILPSEERVGEKIPVVKITLWAYCSAKFTQISPELAGTAPPSDIKKVYVYEDTDGKGTLNDSDLLLGSGGFGADGKASIPLSINNTPPVVYDSSYTIFVVYETSITATPENTVGIGLSDSQDGLAFPGEAGASGMFGYYRSGVAKLLHKETPDKPRLSLEIPWPSGKKVGEKTVYYNNDPSGFSFSWSSWALYGVTETHYAVASFEIKSITDIPDVSRVWFVTKQPKAVLTNMNLKHGNTYYLWVKSVSIVNNVRYERANSATIKIDLTPPSKPQRPSDTSPKNKTIALSPSETIYWVNWQEVHDDESGILYYELQEKTDTSPIWQTVSTTTATYFPITRNSQLDREKLYFYRVRARNYAGSWSEYSDESEPAYLSPPAEILKDLSTYPNPFDSRKNHCKIVYILNQTAKVDLRIYDLFGNPVKLWLFEPGSRGGRFGLNEITWDGTNEQNQKVAMGMYILTIEVKTSDDKTSTKRWKIGVIH